MSSDTSIAEVRWLAGLLEGEGSFFSSKSGTPQVDLTMTDQDVVEHAHTVMRATASIGRFQPASPPGKTYKPAYRCVVYGRLAAGWMMMLYPLLGQRRRAKIREVLQDWRSRVAPLPRTR